VLSPKQYAIALIRNAGIEVENVTSIRIEPDGGVTAHFARRLVSGEFETWELPVPFSGETEEVPPSVLIFTDEAENIVKGLE
jgi:hypothetical protein